VGSNPTIGTDNMHIEYEATFPNINKSEMRSKLKKAGANLVKPEFLQRRVAYYLPGKIGNKHSWIRVRDEGDKVTLSIKRIEGEQIKDQKEICIIVNDFRQARRLLSTIGCQEKAYQETKRELWILGNVEITIDEWPYLEPFLEIEGESEEAVKDASEKIGFSFKDALFCAADTLYSKKYGVPKDKINNHTRKITFKDKNPFITNSTN
jgi:adenylate cyclase class 2